MRLMAVKMYTINVFLCFLVLILCPLLCNAAKLTVPRILLPYNSGTPTNYTLEVKEGHCYKWSSSRTDLVTVTSSPFEGEELSCSTRAVVSAVSRYSERENAIILAEDPRTNQVLRCDVVIDAIHSVEIVTTTRVLFLEDAPEVFEVIAKNNQGDTFSSLEGIAFQWALDGDSYNTDSRGVLRLLKFADSSYKTPPAIEYWESQNLHGSMILMEGSKTGSSKVTVKPLNNAYKHVQPYEVSLVIVANLNLKPSNIFLLPGTKIEYQLELIKQGRAYPVSLPSPQYYLEIVDQKIANLDSKKPVLEALALGTTSVVVKDKYTADREIAYLPSAIVHVTQPSYMTLSVQPGDKWILQEERTYFVSVNIFDRNSYPIYLAEEIQVEFSFPSQFFKVLYASKNGTYQEILTLTSGICQIGAELIGVTVKRRLVKIDLPVTVTQEVTIHEKIMVTPSVVLLPWDPVLNIKHNVELTATGGTGTYKWKSNDTNVAIVANNADYHNDKALLSTKQKGEVTIFAVDVHMALFSGFAQVSIQPVTSFQLLPDIVEVYVGENLNIPFAAFGHFNRDGPAMMFHDCTKIPISVEFHDGTKFQYIQQENSPFKKNSCRNIQLQCLGIGYDRVHIGYLQIPSPRSTIVAACHRKLVVLHPHYEVVLALGSTSDVVFGGGPTPWVTCRENYYADLSSKQNLLQIEYAGNNTIEKGVLRVYQAACKDIGEADVEFALGNRPCASNEFPISATANSKIFCSIPQTLRLRPVISMAQCPASPDDVMAVHNQQDIMIELVVKDSSGRTFYNISSLDVSWTISDKNLVTMDNQKGFSTKLHQKLPFRRIEKNYKELHPQGLEGSFTVTATISGYKNEYLSHYGISKKQVIKKEISHALTLNLVEEVEVVPKKISLFNNPSNKVLVNITKGSGYFQVKSSTDKAKIVYKESTKQIEIIPLSAGIFTINVVDLCVPSKDEEIIHVHVYGISAILLNVLDKVELGKSVIASVEVLNEDKQRISSSVFSLMNLEPLLSSNIVSVSHATNLIDPYRALYHIQGLALGNTVLKFATTLDTLKDAQYVTDDHNIQVFSRLRVNPNNVTLVVGATFQVMCSGGPTPQANIEYVIEDNNKASVTTGGLIEAKKLGNSFLVARSVGYDDAGQTVVFSQDRALVQVIALKKIKIHTPLTRMIAGSEMPVYAVGWNDYENPFVFGSALPAMEFRWSVSNEKVVSVNDRYKDAGLHNMDENNFSVHLNALEDGQATLHLDVIAKDTHGNQANFLSDEVQIQVYKKLKLVSPVYEEDMILLAPNSELKLRCNRFTSVPVSYSIMVPKGENNRSPVATVNSQGILTALSKTGTAVLVVKATEDFGINQHLSVTVKVEDVAYMMLKLNTEIPTKEWQLQSLPIGFIVPFTVTYHDNVGRVFSAVRSQLKFRQNRLDYAHISFGSKNTTLLVQVLKPGVTVLRIWDSGFTIASDFMKISAGYGVDPVDAQLIVGDVVCFGSPLVTNEGHSGTWSTENSVLAIHPNSGGAIALNTGTTSVMYSLSEAFTTSTQVTVYPADQIAIQQGTIEFVTNVKDTKPYVIPVVIQSNAIQRSVNVIGRNCTTANRGMHLPEFRIPFLCDVFLNLSLGSTRTQDVFSVESGFDVSEGVYYCRIQVNDEISQLDYSELDAHLTLTVSPDLTTKSFKSQKLILPFLPAFSVLGGRIVISGVSMMGIVQVKAAPMVQESIQVSGSHSKYLKILSPTKQSPSILVYPVRLLSMPQDLPSDVVLYLNFACEKIGQSVQVPILVESVSSVHTESTCATPLMPDYIYVGILAIAFLTAIWFLCIFTRHVATYRRATVTSDPVFMNSNTNGSFTSSQNRFTPSPPRLSHSNLSSSSHREDPYESLSQRTKLWTLDSPQKSVSPRRRQVFTSDSGLNTSGFEFK